MNKDSSSQPLRRGYISGSEFFFFSCAKKEVGTNKRHRASPELARLILSGLDAYEVRRARVEGINTFPGEVYEILDEQDKLIAIRVDEPKLIFDGLKGCMELLSDEFSVDQRGLAHWAAKDLEGFIRWLDEAGIYRSDTSS